MDEPLYVVALVGIGRLGVSRSPLYLQLVSNPSESRITADWQQRRCATEMPRATAQAAASVVAHLRPELRLSIEEAR